jgi:hypothetical protein
MAADSRLMSDDLRVTTDDVRLFGVSALVFVASAALTIVWCTSMSMMGDMPSCWSSG